MADDLYNPIGFSKIDGYPHDITEKAIDKLLSFQGNSAISAKTHLNAFKSVLHKSSGRHEYVHIELIVLLLET